MENLLIVSAAGSGKTTLLVSKALEIKDKAVLITTYTEANELEIKNKFFEINGSVPSNVTILTWFSFLINHGIKPFQNFLFDYRVNGMILVNKQSGLRYVSKKGFPVYFDEESFFDEHYFTKDKKIFSDKLSKLVHRINEKSDGRVMDRVANIYPNIFIDESQDLAGYDLDLVKLIAQSSVSLILVCDPRQVTYLTHLERKNTKYRNGLLENFILNECKDLKFEIDNNSLNKSYRCNKEICSYSDRIYPNFPSCESAQENRTGHDGIFLVRENEIEKYLKAFNPIQLRWSSSIDSINKSYPVINFGLSKGLTFDRVLIYPTNAMLGWMKGLDLVFSDEARAKFYVGITRARYSVGIVCEEIEGIIMEGVHVYE